MHKVIILNIAQNVVGQIRQFRHSRAPNLIYWGVAQPLNTELLGRRPVANGSEGNMFELHWLIWSIWFVDIDQGMGRELTMRIEGQGGILKNKDAKNVTIEDALCSFCRVDNL